jgi:DNA-binding XRE family transcriptional regulator
MTMNRDDFKGIRKRLGKTQKQLAELLGISLKTIHSYEQGWRTVPTHAEKLLYFLYFNQRGRKCSSPRCWEEKLCTVKEQCPAWEFDSGHMCWYMSGTLCDCTNGADEKEKIEICKSCKIFSKMLHA